MILGPKSEHHFFIIFWVPSGATESTDMCARSGKVLAPGPLVPGLLLCGHLPRVALGGSLEFLCISLQTHQKARACFSLFRIGLDLDLSPGSWWRVNRKPPLHTNPWRHAVQNARRTGMEVKRQGCILYLDAVAEVFLVWEVVEAEATVGHVITPKVKVNSLSYQNGLAKVM